MFRSLSSCSVVLSLLLTGLVALPVSARPGDNCSDLFERIKRQERIKEAFRCDLVGAVWQVKWPRLARYRNQCQADGLRRLRTIAGYRARSLELCVEVHAEDYARGDWRAASDKKSGQAIPDESRAPATGRPQSADVSREQREAEQRYQNAERRIRDLLAQTPGGEALLEHSTRWRTAKRTAPTLDLTSRISWSYAGKISGMSCIQWNEPEDPHTWHDNYLCTKQDMGLRWSHRGPILGRGLHCTLVKEASDPHGWHDNYLCWPRNLPVEFKFSSAGRMPGYQCLAIIEPSDPHTWRDNYLCHRPKSERARQAQNAVHGTTEKDLRRQ